ncbi:excalibur calcium-binding domain-containing protein [Geodermatophilus sp. DF01-2]|uniref:excalibur calcium-binding domain-containing protein n=1 Tax=Geodermatophilus sp. DF01-2 TaxID=2559610 RepID=UPI0010738B3D|nr:excalibur calcium-binding domain-containing protein [Geodermatophilus sp. DF01_2]TFV62243.1 excalibur calcium-binding domain-containing protein [Geodermatophilus sp. DF01_2]
MRRTTATAGVLVTAVLTLGLTGTANAATDRDCPDFASQAEAQAAFDAVPGDPERLDADDDGIACEEQQYAPTASASGQTGTGGPQVSTRPSGAVAAGDGSAGEDGSALPYVLGGAALAAAGGAAVAARRSSRTSA